MEYLADFFGELCFTGWIQCHPGLITPLLRFMWTFLFSSPQGRWFVLTNWIKISSINSISGECSKEDAKNEDHWPYGVFRLQSGNQGAGPRHWPHHSYSQTNKKSAREDRHHHQGRKVGVVAITNNKNNWLAPTAVDVQLSCVCKWWWCQPQPSSCCSSATLQLPANCLELHKQKTTLPNIPELQIISPLSKKSL